MGVADLAALAAVLEARLELAEYLTKLATARLQLEKQANTQRRIESEQRAAEAAGNSAALASLQEELAAPQAHH